MNALALAQKLWGLGIDKKDVLLPVALHIRHTDPNKETVCTCELQIEFRDMPDHAGKMRKYLVIYN